MTPDTLITTRGEYNDALRTAFADIQEAPCREIWLCDEHFSDWPLGERQTIECLTRWATSSRRLVLLARSFDEVARRHPRWVRWRQDWSHIVSCRTNVELQVGEFPSIFLAAGTLTVRLSDVSHHRGRVSRTNVEQVRCKELLDAVLQRSEEAFPATTTGL